MGNDPVVVDRATRGNSLALVGGGVLVVLAASLPFWGESSWMRDVVELSCYLIFAMMWNLLAGYGGMVASGSRRSSASAAMRCWCLATSRA